MLERSVSWHSTKALGGRSWSIAITYSSASGQKIFLLTLRTHIAGFSSDVVDWRSRRDDGGNADLSLPSLQRASQGINTENTAAGEPSQCSPQRPTIFIHQRPPFPSSEILHSLPSSITAHPSSPPILHHRPSPPPPPTNLPPPKISQWPTEASATTPSG